MVLNAQEESLINVVRTLPPGEATKILHWVRSLASLGNGSPVDWSDTWTEEDLTEATASALRQIEKAEQ
ncbi:MAG: hypothetical protein ABL962_20855 [Fimbriimonadaceae bacterium]